MSESLAPERSPRTVGSTTAGTRRPLRERLTASTRWTVAVATTLALLTTLTVSGAMSAQAEDDYPTWSDVEKARGNEAAKKREISRIRTFIRGIEAEIQEAQDEVERTGTIFQEAQQLLDEATTTAEQLQARADEAQATAEESTRRAGILATQLSRSTGGDTTLQLFLSDDSQTDMLYQLGTVDQLGSQSAAVFARAQSDQNAAEALFDEAEVAQEARAVLAADAQAKFEIAQDAAEKLQKKLDSYQSTLTTLNEQLASLTENRKEAEEGYREWVNDTYGGTSGDVEISSAGWARPVVGGYISSNYGSRVDPTYGTWRFHYGTDFGGLGCGAPIYAASSGTVTYAGWYGGYGNALIVSHGNGQTTLYAHQVNNGFKVKYGQEVVVGQRIGTVGTTGKSTGCHLHFEVRVNGSATDPKPFMRSRGVTL